MTIFALSGISGLSTFICHESQEESFFQFNVNLLETNLFNILILLGILFYAYQVSFRQSLENRQQEIFQIIENAQKEVLLASQSYQLAEKAFTQSFFWFQSWKSLYEKEKEEVISNQYFQLRVNLAQSFELTENLVTTLEKKSFSDLQRYVLFLTASKILRKFVSLSEMEQSSLIETNFMKI